MAVIGVWLCMRVGVVTTLGGIVSGGGVCVFGVIPMVDRNCGVAGTTVVGIVTVFLMGRLCRNQQVTTMLRGTDDDRCQIEPQSGGDTRQGRVRTSPDGSA